MQTLLVGLCLASAIAIAIGVGTGFVFLMEHGPLGVIAGVALGAVGVELWWRIWMPFLMDRKIRKIKDRNWK